MTGTQNQLVPNVRKIAVLRANAIGDYLFSLPALEALRRAYPQAEIVLLGQHWHNGFLTGRPGPVDRVIPIPPARGVGQGEEYPEDPADLDRFFVGLSAECFDLAIQMHGGGRHSNPFVLRLNARLTAGMKTPEAAPLDRWLPYFYWQHEIWRCLDIVGLVGAAPPSSAPVMLEPRLQLTQKDLDDSYRAYPQDGFLAFLHPGAGDPRRRWPPEKFAAVGDGLAAAGARVIVGGIESEKEVSAAVVGAMQAKATNLCGRLSLEGLAGLLSRCRVVVSNDSGPLHMAGALGVPNVGVYWCGNMINAAPLSRLRHRPAISWRLTCLVCGKNTFTEPCRHPVSFVADVPVEQVLAYALEMAGG